jgi:hypothetical protein
MRHDDINFAADARVFYRINYLLRASIGGGTFYGEVISGVIENEILAVRHNLESAFGGSITASD